MLLAAKLARWGDRLLTLAAALLLGALALFGAWSLWDIAATRRAALPEQTLRFKPLAAAPADSPGFAELRALNPDVCGWLTLDGTRIDFPITRQDIAEMTGTTLHTVSRLLSAWEGLGLVTGGRQKLTVTDAAGLAKIADPEF